MIYTRHNFNMRDANKFQGKLAACLRVIALSFVFWRLQKTKASITVKHCFNTPWFSKGSDC